MPVPNPMDAITQPATASFLSIMVLRTPSAIEIEAEETRPTAARRPAGSRTAACARKRGRGPARRVPSRRESPPRLPTATGRRSARAASGPTVDAAATPRRVPRLPASARPGQRDEPHVVAVEQRVDGDDLEVPAEERCRRRGQRHDRLRLRGGEQRRVLVEDALLERLQLRSRVDPELVDERALRSAIRIERVLLAGRRGRARARAGRAGARGRDARRSAR